MRVTLARRAGCLYVSLDLRSPQPPPVAFHGDGAERASRTTVPVAFQILDERDLERLQQYPGEEQHENQQHRPSCGPLPRRRDDRRKISRTAAIRARLDGHQHHRSREQESFQAPSIPARRAESGRPRFSPCQGIVPGPAGDYLGTMSPR